MKKLDFAEYIRRTDLIDGCDRKHLNAWARTTLHGDQHLGIQILNRKDFGDEPLTDIIRRIVKPVYLKDLKVSCIDEQNNAVEFVFK